MRPHRVAAYPVVGDILPSDILAQGQRAYAKLLAMCGAGLALPGFSLTMTEIPVGDSGVIEWVGTYQLAGGYTTATVTLELMAVTDQEYQMAKIAFDLAAAGGTWNYTPAFTGTGTKVARLRAAPSVDYPDGQILAEAYPNRGIVKSYLVPEGEMSNGVELWTILHDRCFTYDQAVAVCCACAYGDQANAERLAQGLMWCQVPMSYPADQRGRIPFSVNANGWIPAQGWTGFIDPYFRTGAEMWCAYALAWFSNTFPASALAAAAKTSCRNLLDGVLTNHLNAGGGGDYRDGLITGGLGQYSLPDYLTFNPSYVVPWVSTEHTLDAYHALAEAVAAGITSAAGHNYSTLAAQLATKLQTVLWDAAAAGSPTPRAYQGTLAASKDTAHALDCGSWLSIAYRRMGATSLAAQALASTDPYAVSYAGGTLYTPYLTTLGYPDTVLAPWGEGSAGLALARLAAGQYAESWAILRDLLALEGDTGYLYVSIDIAPYELQDWPSAASTGWVALACKPTGFWSVS